jgi:hypothetical protein
MRDNVEPLAKIAAAITNPLALAAFLVVILAGLIVAIRKRNSGGTVPNAVAAVMALAIVVPVAAWVYKDRAPGTYHIRLTVLDPQNRPVDDARIVPSVGNEPLKVPGGYQIEVSADKKPADGKVTLIATEPGTFYRGEISLVLGSEMNPPATIHLTVDTENVTISGMVQDRSGRAISGATVTVAGHGDEKVTTDDTGSFTLKAHAPVGQKVLLHAEKKNVGVVNELHLAGPDPAVLVLKH